MKKVIEDLASRAKLETAYDGTIRVMYIKGERNKEFIAHVHEKYPTLAFELKAVDTFEKPIKFIGRPHSLTSENMSLQTAILDLSDVIKDSGHTTLEQREGIFEEVLEEKTNIKKKFSFEEVDAYLLQNPVDRKTKGPYDAAATLFGVKTDYIRKRWARLREQGLVEKESQTQNI